MTGLPFSEREQDFLRITAASVFGVATTVDEHGRPRSRMLHPIFPVRGGRPLGRAPTGRTPLKTRPLAANPRMSCSFWTPSHDTVFVDCRTAQVEGDAEKERVWELFHETSPPLGWGPEGMAGYGTERRLNPVFTPLRLTPQRVQAMTGDNHPTGDLTGRVWRAP